MRWPILAITSLSLLSALALGAPAPAPPLASRARPDPPPIPLAKLYTSRTATEGTFSPDGSRVAFITNISGRANIWIVPSQGGWPVQLTVSDQRQAAPIWSPDGKWILYQSDYDGDEQWDLFVVSPDDGEVKNLTATPDVAEEEAVFSPDGRYLAYAAKPRDGSSHEIYLMELGSQTVRPLTSGTRPTYGNHGPRFSADGKWLAYNQMHASEKDENIYLIELATQKTTLLTPHQGEQFYSVAAFSPDGKQLFIQSNARNGYTNVALLDVASKKLTWLTQERGEVFARGFSPDGRLLAWVRNDDGNFAVDLYDRASGRATTLPLPPGLNDLGFQDKMGLWSRDGARLLICHGGPDRPHGLWVFDMRSKSARPITESLVGGLRPGDLITPSRVHYRSFDGRRISAFLYVPANLRRDGKNPAVVYVHGGPNDQFVNDFVRPIQYLASRGHVVIAPNYRGSTGYGKEFQDLNRMDMGGGDLKDVVGAAEFLKSTGYVDPRRIALMGMSYGGYMTMMGLTKAPAVWAAGVAIVPFVNWFTEVKNEDPQLREYDLATMGDPIKDSGLWRDRSPINFLDRIRAPLLMLAGRHDPRCPPSEADQVAATLRRRGGVVEYKVYDDEGHSFARLENQLDAIQRVAIFLERALKR